MAKQTPGSRCDAGSKYELSVTALFSSLLSKNENVENYRIFSNFADAHPFDDIVAEVQFKDAERSQLYAIQIKSGRDRLDINKYYDGYDKIIKDGGLKLKEGVRNDDINFLYFCNRSPNKNAFPLKVNNDTIDLKRRLRCRPYNVHEAILERSDCFELYSDSNQTTTHQSFLDNLYLYLNQPDTQNIIHRIKGIWHVNNPWQIISFLDSYFAKNTNVLDKATFEHEVLKIRLSDYIVTPTKAIPFNHKAVLEWNRLTLEQDVTIVRNESNVEQYLFGCILQSIADVIHIDEWNGFVDKEGKLDSDVKRRLKPKPFVAETLKDLMLQTWIDNRIPLILRSDALLEVLREFSHLNRKYIIIDPNIAKRSVEIESYGLTVFSHLGDVFADEMMKNIPVSMQGREPTSLYEIINEAESLREAVTCLDVINLMRGRRAYVNRKYLSGNDHILFIIETANLPQHSRDEEQPGGTNIVIHCEPNQGGERYSEIRADPRYKTYKIFHLRSTDDNKLTLISKTDARGITQKGGGHRGLECFFVDENDENIYYMDNGDVIPVIGEVPIRTCWRYVPRHLREHVKANTKVPINASTLNEFSTECRKNLLTEREFFKEDNGKMVIVTGEPGIGKTELLHSLFYFYESKYYVLFVDLAQHQLALRDGKLISFEDLLNLSRDRCSSLPYNSFLTSLREYSNRLVVILDSFDEILATCEQNILKFIQNLEKIGLHKIIIASRLTALDPLINDFEARTIKVEGINEQSNKDYNDIWNLDINNLRRMPSEFLTNPLYLNMLRAISESGMNFGVKNRWNLYESVVNLKMEKYCRYRCLYEDDKESILTKHGELALNVVFGSNKVTEKLKQWTQSSFIGLGFITHYDNEYPVFVHRTFAEFFIAKWLIKNIGSDDATYIYRLMLDTNQASLLNIHSEVFPLHKAIIDEDVKEIERLCRENINCMLEVDGFGRSCLHLAVIHLFFRALKFLCQRLSQTGFNIRLCDKVMGWNCVDYFEKCKYIRRSPISLYFRFKEIYWNYYATHIEKLDESTLPFTFNDLYCTAIRKSSIGLLRDLLFLKYSRDETFLRFREMCLHSNAIPNTKLLSIHLRKEKLGGIHLACIYSNIQIVRAYAQNRASFNQADKFNCLPLHYSIIAGQNEILKLVLENCVISSPYAGAGDETTTILHMTMRTDDMDVMKMVLERVNINLRQKRIPKRLLGVNTSFSNRELLKVQNPKRLEIVKTLLTTPDFQGYTPLKIAVRNGSKDLVKILIEYYAYAERFSNNVIRRQKSEILESLLQHEANVLRVCLGKIYNLVKCAIQREDEDIVRLLLDYNAHVNLNDIEWGTLLTNAIHRGNLKLTEMLLQRGGRTNCINLFDLTCLIEAIKTRKQNVVQLLLNYNADVNLQCKDGSAPLKYALISENLEIIELILRSGASINNRDSDGKTPLINAVSTGKQDTVQLLLDHEADVNLKGQDGISPLNMAIKIENFKIIEILLLNEASINYTNSKDDTPLLYAIRTGKKDIVQLLLDYKVDVNFECEDGVTPLEYALIRENLEIIELLLRSGARIDNRDSIGETPLIYAVRTRKKDIVQLLLDHGADVNLGGIDGITPLDVAIDIEDLYVIGLLLRSGTRSSIRN